MTVPLGAMESHGGMNVGSIWVMASREIGEQEWPFCQEDDLPPGASPSLRGHLKELDEASRQARVALGTFYLFLELTRKRPFVDAVNNTPVAFGVRIVVGALVRDLIISLSSLFDQHPGATDLRRIVNALLHPENNATFKSFHGSYPVPYDTAAGKARLVSYKRRLGKGSLGDALQRILDLRSQAVAHRDLNPEFPHGRPLIRDIDHMLAGACLLIWNANFFALGRQIDATQLRRMCRAHASSLADVIVMGLRKDEAR